MFDGEFLSRFFSKLQAVAIFVVSLVAFFRLFFEEPISVHVTTAHASATSNARFSSTPTSELTVIDARALLWTGSAATVYVVQGSTVSRRSVRVIGLSAHGQATISGLSQGSKVALGDLARLTEGMRVRVIE